MSTVSLQVATQRFILLRSFCFLQNYTGDNLHFGLAAQQARANGVRNIDILPVTDDVSVGRKGGGLVGRRALAGTVLGM